MLHSRCRHFQAGLKAIKTKQSWRVKLQGTLDFQTRSHHIMDWYMYTRFLHLTRWVRLATGFLVCVDYLPAEKTIWGLKAHERELYLSGYTWTSKAGLENDAPLKKRRRRRRTEDRLCLAVTVLTFKWKLKGQFYYFDMFFLWYTWVATFIDFECLLIIQLSIPFVIQTSSHLLHRCRRLARPQRPPDHRHMQTLQTPCLTRTITTFALPQETKTITKLSKSLLNRWCKCWPVIRQHPLLLVDLTGQ